MISTGEPKGIQPFSVSHVVLSDPTSAQGHEERGRTERRGMGEKIARDVEQMAGNGGKGEMGMKRGQKREMVRG